MSIEHKYINLNESKEKYMYLFNWYLFISYAVCNSDNFFFPPQARMFELDAIRGKYGINDFVDKLKTMFNVSSPSVDRYNLEYSLLPSSLLVLL